MKFLFCVLLSVLTLGSAHATDEAVCPARGGSQQSAPIDAAIARLDNARVALPSPSLASGTLSYLTIYPNFAERLDRICVLGYFELRRGAQVLSLPFTVDSVEVVKLPSQSAPEQTQANTRIFFRVPSIADFDNQTEAQRFWRFWDRDQTLHLKIAAFAYADEVRGEPYFGRDLPLTVSGKGGSVVAALLFAVFFYLLAAAAIPTGARSINADGKPGRRWRGGAGRLLPWNITGANGQASLSQLQMLMFTLIVATLLFYQWLRTGLLQELSTDLLYLIGISTAGTAASQVATNIRKDLDPLIYQYVQQLGWFTAPIAEIQGKGRPSGLLLTNKRFDIYKFQMLVFTFVIAAYVIASGANELGNIQISATLLTLMGMSQGAYVGGRAAADQLSPLQDQLRGMQNLQQRYRDNADPNVALELRRQFQLAAAQAGATFGVIYNRVLPSHMLDMPVDALAALAPSAPPAT
ncbi:hypothetical protein SAMN05192549_102260 [Duganella sacchari]|uniref:Uncharacterized protein n=1 Tax=Duganella sacchari TaxID=551987 RepID=A0A1M7KWC5_9BURK|nr:hypothetical protein [Duganella sacchari]SHM69812.1 hypothetical protein SAMN05192549_102260 [Duganella sacchari]